MRHECRSPCVKTFWRSAVVGKFLTETLLLLHLQPIHKTTVFHAAASTGWNRRIFLLKLFNISAPLLKKLLKHTSAHTVHAKVIVKPARVEV